MQSCSPAIPLQSRLLPFKSLKLPGLSPKAAKSRGVRPWIWRLANELVQHKPDEAGTHADALLHCFSGGMFRSCGFNAFRLGQVSENLECLFAEL